MDRQQMYQSIYTHDTIYIPPREEGSAALEAALGCSWHQCAFCDFARDPFRVFPMEDIERKLRVLGHLQPEQTRLFLLGENAFVLPADQLLAITALARRYMPRIGRVAMYARVDDVLDKTDQELDRLRQAGICALHIGVESGCDPILLHCRKGVTAAETVEALRRLERAGIERHVTVIPGLGGREYSRLHAIETARLLNQARPSSIWCLKLHLYEGTALYRDAQAGRFTPMEPAEALREERLMLENLTVENCLFEDTTVLDRFTIRGMLPDGKGQLLDAIDYLLATQM